MTHRRHRPRTVPAALAAALLLSGCGAVTVVNDEEAASSTTSTTSKATSDASTTPPADTPSGPASDEDGTSAPTDGDLTYAAAAARLADATKEIPCDRGPVTVPGDGATVRLVGSCGAVTLTGEVMAVLADDVESVTISGSGTGFVARSIGAVTFTSSAFASEVYWVSGQPTVTDDGSGNVARSIPEGP